MPRPLNPYISQEPVGGTPAFVGRTKLLEDIGHELEAGKKNIFIYGQRRIGKTSLLIQLKAALASKGSFAPVYVDLDGKAGLPLDQILLLLTREMFRELGISPISGPSGDMPDVFQNHIVPHVRSSIPKDRVPVLIFDEFNVPEPRSETPGAFFSYMQKLTSDPDPGVRFIFAIGRCPGDIYRIHHALFPDARLCPVSLLSPDETNDLIRLSEQNHTLKWPKAQTAAVWNITAGHPYLTQNLCREIWNKIYETAHQGLPIVHFKEVGGCYADAVKAAAGAFEWIWEGLSPWERAAASALAGGEQTLDPGFFESKFPKIGLGNLEAELNQSAALLQDWGIIQKEKGKYIIPVSMFSRWIMARKPLERVREEFQKMAAAVFHSARQSCRRGEMAGAEQLLKQTLDLNPEHAKAGELLGKILLKQERADEARRILEPLFEQYKTPVLRSLYVYALTLQAEKVPDEARRIPLYENILNLEPGHPRIRIKYQRYYEKIGDDAHNTHRLSEALEAYERAGADKKAEKTRLEIRRIEAAQRLEALKNRRRRQGRSLFRWAFAICLFAGISAAVLFVGYQHFSHDLPQIHSLKDYHPPVVTSVYDNHNRKIAEFYKERRIVIPLQQMSETLIQAFISAEDSRFFTHKGLDLFSIIRAFFKNVEAGSIVQGGSTITQQVVKSFLLSPEKTYERKIKEAILAYRLDQSFSKEEVLFLYLNQIYLGHGAYGVEAAAQNYFGKSADTLDLAECSVLAGLAQAPSKDSPFTHPDRAKNRQLYVLTRMMEEGHITDEQAQTASRKALDIRPRQNLFLEHVPYYTEHVRQYVEETYGADALYTGGLEIYTPVDVDLQKMALEKLEDGLKALESRHTYPDSIRPQGSLLCMDLKTGRVLAMAGGRDFRENQFNRAIQARRQPGSAFKPIIYAAALDKGYSPVSRVYDTPLAIPDNGKIWRPTNYDKRYYGPLPLRKALAKSRNIPVVRVLQDIGIEYAIAYARMLGITSDLNRGLSLALGASGVSLLEMTTAYSVFANQGAMMKPVFVTRIVDRFGKEIYAADFQPDRAMEPSTAFLMNSLLQSVITEGTGYKAKKLNHPVAGKTGTTNDFRDAWFIGYTADYITGVWVGFDIERSMGKGETGSTAACPIWLDFMQELLKDQPVKEFPEPPEDIVYVLIDMETGYPASPDSQWVTYECFKEGALPSRPHITTHAVITEAEDFFKTGM
jgi:penicillin-binding protein 1A